MTFPGQPPQSYGPPPVPHQPGYPPHGYAVPPGAGHMPGYQPVPLAPDGRPLASFGDRLVARLVDVGVGMLAGLVLLIPLVGAIVLLVTASGASDAGSDGADVVALLGSYAMIFVAIFGLQYLYEVEWQLRKGGQTVGKRVAKIAVVAIAPGQPLTRGMLVRRWLVWSVAGLFVCGFAWLDGLWQLWDKPYQQCLHDKAAQTVVVKVAAR